MLRSIPKTVSTDRTNSSRICPTSSVHSRRPHHRCRSETRDDDRRTRNQRGARNADTEHRPLNAESHGLLRRIERETEKKRVHRGERAKKRTRGWITRTECLHHRRWSSFAKKNVLRSPSASEMNDYSGRSSEMSIGRRRSLWFQGYELRERVPN